KKTGLSVNWPLLLPTVRWRRVPAHRGSPGLRPTHMRSNRHAAEHWPGGLLQGNREFIPGKSVDFAQKQEFHQGFLYVQTVLGFFPHHALRTVDDVAGDFFAAMGGQAMHE